MAVVVGSRVKVENFTCIMSEFLTYYFPVSSDSSVSLSPGTVLSSVWHCFLALPPLSGTKILSLGGVQE